VNNLFISPEAENDLDAIEAYIGEDNPVAATQFIERLTQNFERLVHNPRIGRKRDEILPGMRSLAHRPYVIFYLIDEETVTIVRVIHGSMDIRAIFTKL
jgi:toxin ParE1/3/4